MFLIFAHIKNAVYVAIRESEKIQIYYLMQKL